MVERQIALESPRRRRQPGAGPPERAHRPERGQDRFERVARALVPAPAELADALRDRFIRDLDNLIKANNP